MPEIRGISLEALSRTRHAARPELRASNPLGEDSATVAENSSTSSTTSINSPHIVVSASSPSWVQSHPIMCFVLGGTVLATGSGIVAALSRVAWQTTHHGLCDAGLC